MSSPGRRTVLYVASVHIPAYACGASVHGQATAPVDNGREAARHGPVSEPAHACTTYVPASADAALPSSPTAQNAAATSARVPITAPSPFHPGSSGIRRARAMPITGRT